MGLENLEIKDKGNKLILYNGSNGSIHPVVLIEGTELGRYVVSFNVDAADPRANFNRIMLFLLAAHRTHDIPPDIRGGYCEDPLNQHGYPVQFDVSRAYDPAHADEMFRRSAALSFSMETDMFPFIGIRSSVADNHLPRYLPGMWNDHTHAVTLETRDNISHDLSNLLIGIDASILSLGQERRLQYLLDGMVSRVMEGNQEERYTA